MKKKYGREIFLLLLCFLLGSCQSTKLEEKSQHFSTQMNEYTFQLPSKWEKDKKFKERYNKETIYAAEDTRSLSTLSVRPRGEAKNKKEFTQQVKKLLLEIYGENKEPAKGKIAHYPTYEYLVQSRVDNKLRWVHLYYIYVGGEIIEVQLKTPQDRRDEERTKIIKQSLATLKGTTIKRKTTHLHEEEMVNQAEGNDFNFQVTGYRFAAVDDDKVLVVRFTCTNKGTESVIPINEWQQAVHLSQENQTLDFYQGDSAKLADDLHYLQEQGKKALQPEQSVESVSLYRLVKGQEDVRMEFNQDIFPNKETIWMKDEK